jgi:hypothetical protein
MGANRSRCGQRCGMVSTEPILVYSCTNDVHTPAVVVVPVEIYAVRHYFLRSFTRGSGAS